ncbi:sodium:solute symporter family transporter [Xanthobacter agilis]|uniref:Cation/acetate symporter n=1 Tax=Xanthobacter agilis TaxID=47492 RepID=A0ABU0LJY8_XANAG|nr:cation acetate symporter [Xanthobacter agilis]MDQ0507460.1 cation/acetate symporter [Xanthobacter agilis]
MNTVAITCFIAIVLLSLAITWWAARHTKGTSDFYAAGGNITSLQNGLALAGDALSAGAFLGLTGLIFTSGFDGYIYAIGYSTGMPIVVFLLAERLRRLGKFTFSDVVSLNLEETPMRIFGAVASLVVIAFYLIAQLAGAGALIELLFGISFKAAVALVGVLMICYVMFGGMMATTWVQIVKACLMLVGGAVIAGLVLQRFGFDISAILKTAAQTHPKGAGVLAPAAASHAPFSALSLALALMFGTAGLPHILMRFFTVPDARAARNSVVWGTAFISTFYAATAIFGFGAIVILAGDPSAIGADGKVLGGVNMVAIHLSRILGGNVMLGLVSAVAFATILAVVAGLTLAGASAVSHDLYARVVLKGHVDDQRELKISRIATVVLGLLAIALGIAFEGQNVAYMISLAFAIACSSTFPVLLLSIYWRGLTTRGAIAGGSAGLLAALVLTVLGPSMWVKVFGFAAPMVSLDPPTLISMPLAFLTCWLVSRADRQGLGAGRMPAAAA